MTVQQEWDRTIRWLRITFPVGRKVYIRYYNDKRRKLCGYCKFSKSGKSFIVFIRSNQVSQSKFDTLLHEWAHLIAWERERRDYHNQAWGVAFSRIYREFEKWNFGIRAK